MIAVKMIILFLAYFFSAKIGLKVDTVSGFATLAWSPSGIAVAALLLFGRNLWPGIFLGAFAVNFFQGATFLTATGIGVGNTLEAIVAAHLLTKWQDFHKNFNRLKDVLLFLVLACGFSSIFSATIGVLSLWCFGQLNEPAHLTWKAWWTGDAFGMLIISPLILCWSTFKINKIKWWKVIELVIFTTIFSYTCYLVFRQMNVLAFWIFPLIVWAALSFGQVGNVTVSFIISVMAIWGTANNLGPFSMTNVHDNLFVLSCFMFISTTTGMILASVFTERKIAMEALEQAIQTRDEFLSIASHELKTPITSLSLQLQMLRYKASSPEGLNRSLDISVKQVKRIGELIDNLLNVSLMRTGRFSYKFEDANLSSIVMGMTKRHEIEFQKAGSPLVMSIQENIHGHYDPLRMEQVLDNLFTNALKYARGSEIKVSLYQDNETTLVIEDSGPGIPEHRLSKIFDRYERVHHSTSVSGLGLGLFIVKEIVEGHNGKILLKNKPTGGTKFIMTFK